MSPIAPTVQLFFTGRMARQRQASSHTRASYRDTFRLLFEFVQQRLGKSPSAFEWDDRSHETISAFLEHLEIDRNNSARTRIARLGAIRSLFVYASLRHPEHAALISGVLAIPPKRFDKATVSYLTPAEVGALIAAPDRSRWGGRRDHALLILAIQTGLRVSELTSLNGGYIGTGTGVHVQCRGKELKERAVPLTHPTALVLREGMAERNGQGIRCSPRAREALEPRRRGTTIGHAPRHGRIDVQDATDYENQPAHPAPLCGRR